MAKKKQRKRIQRQDKVKKKLPTIHQGTSHSAYTWMRKVKEGIMPAGNTNLRKALDAIEICLVTDYGPLNAAQQVQLNLLRPLLAWWLLHPGTVGGDGKLASDFRWCHSKIESGLKALVELGNKTQDKGPNLKEYIDSTYGNEDTNT